jgi:adenosylcobyric acid synthase
MKAVGRPAKALMFQGTGSDVGKSLIVAGLCRAFANRGLVVRPFKPQNMSNNAAVTEDGGEIGRAQALQARAARVAPCVHMNPVLLKPQSEVGAQLVLQGRVVANAGAREFQSMKASLLPKVLESFESLRTEADLLLVEGAGSAAEINLRANDIANMGFATAAHLPVVLIGDIDRGGVIAQIVGVSSVLDAADRRLVAGFLINKFRGDPDLFAAGMQFMTQRTGWPALGLVPYFREANLLPAEDSMSLAAAIRGAGDGPIVAVPCMAHIANFDDVDPLRLESSVRLTFIQQGQALPGDASLVILPGSKATLQDLAEFRANGWDVDLKAHVRRGGKVLGICGGFQMFGRSIADPDGVEGPPGTAPGLGLLDVETILTGEKALRAASGRSIADDAPFTGYEMHVGRTCGPDRARPILRFDDGRTDGAMSADGRIRGTYVHGLFANDRQRAAWLAWLGCQASDLEYEDCVERTLDALAEHLARVIDLDRLLTIAR